jgi:hypothetical protein
VEVVPHQVDRVPHPPVHAHSNINVRADMLEGLKHACASVMALTPRRLVTRRCPVCDWTASALESKAVTLDCPWCHAPADVVREDWLVALSDVRAQAATYGRAGGLKGGRARAERLSAHRRREIARTAAAARWRDR